MSDEPRRMATADDFASLTTSQLVARKSDLQRKVEAEVKLRNDYKKKVDRLAIMLNEAKEPGQGVCQEIMENKAKIEGLIQQNLRNGQVVFSGLRDAIREMTDKAKSVEDQGEETRRQIKEVRKYLRQLDHHEQLLQMNLLDKMLSFLAWLRHLFYSLIFTT